MASSNVLAFLNGLAAGFAGQTSNPAFQKIGADLKQIAADIEQEAPVIIADAFNSFTQSAPLAAEWQPLADMLIEEGVAWTDAKLGGLLDKAIGVAPPVVTK